MAKLNPETVPSGPYSFTLIAHRDDPVAQDTQGDELSLKINYNPTTKTYDIYIGYVASTHVVIHDTPYPYN